MNKKNFKNFGGKGYYIALILCAVAIGISGYLYYRNTDTKEPVAQHSPTDPTGNGVQAIATEPNSDPTTPTNPAKPTTIQTVSPLSGEIISHYAIDCLSYNQTTRDWRTHDGIDIAAAAGAEVCAAADGTVYTVYEDATLGKTIVIRHDGGYTTTYSSLDPKSDIAAGKAVRKGQAIGTVNNSALMESALGDHLHFSVALNGESIDPTEFLKMK